MEEQLIVDYMNFGKLFTYDNPAIENIQTAGDMILFTEVSECGIYKEQHMVSVFKILSFVNWKINNLSSFDRLKWHKSVDANEAEQKGGNCKVIKEILGMTNSNIWACEVLHVQESFGCMAFNT